MKIYLLIIVKRCISIKANSQFSNCQDLLPYGIFIRIKNIIPMQQQMNLLSILKMVYNGLKIIKKLHRQNVQSFMPSMNLMKGASFTTHLTIIRKGLIEVTLY